MVDQYPSPKGARSYDKLFRGGPRTISSFALTTGTGTTCITLRRAKWVTGALYSLFDFKALPQRSKIKTLLCKSRWDSISWLRKGLSVHHVCIILNLTLLGPQFYWAQTAYCTKNLTPTYYHKTNWGMVSYIWIKSALTYTLNSTKSLKVDPKTKIHAVTSL